MKITLKTSNRIAQLCLIALIIVSNTSCSKYEEGPNFSLRTKKARLAGDWDLVEYIDADGISTQDTNDDYISFNRNGTGTVNYQGYTIPGGWEFTDNKRRLRIFYLDLTDTYIILRLTNDELWLKSPDGDGSYAKYEAK